MTTQPPYTIAEERVLDVLGNSDQSAGDAVVALTREVADAAAQAAAQPIKITVPVPSVNVTVPPCNHAGCHGGTCTVVHTVDDDNLDVLIAFVFVLVVFFISWLVLRGQLAGWEEIRWPAAFGAFAGILFLAVSNGVRRIRR